MTENLTRMNEKLSGALGQTRPTLPRPIRLACSVPHPTDGTSYYRALGPLYEMVKDRRGDLELVMPRRSADGQGWELSWDWLAGCDAVFLQRPAFETHIQFAQLVKSMGIPLWIDWDDDYTCLPLSNPSWGLYMDTDAVRSLMRRLIMVADVVTVATEELRQRMIACPKQMDPALVEQLAAKVVVIPNACHTKFQSYMPRERRVIWRGTDTHDEDIMTVLPQLTELSRLPQLSKWVWHFSGGMPWQVHKAIGSERLEQSPFCGSVLFVPVLAAFGSWVHIVPLERNGFNLCKSNIAWIEATCAGSVVLAPDWPEWRRPGVVTYDSPTMFAEKLRGLMMEYDEKAPHPNVAVSQKYITENLLLNGVNKGRWTVLEGLMEKRRNL